MRLEYFELIDRITEISLDRSKIRAEATVPVSSCVFDGHFPGYPLMPGVLLIEAMAQASGWLLIALMKFDRMPFLAGVKEAKLRQFVMPGERLTLEAGLVHAGSGYAMTTARISAVDKRICDADLTFRIMPFPSAEFRAQMTAAAARIALPMEAAADG